MGSERTMMPVDANGRRIPHLKKGATVHKWQVNPAGTAKKNSSAISSKLVRFYANLDVHIKVGSDPTATTSDMLVKAATAEYIYVGDYGYISAINATAGQTPWVWVHEMTGTP